MSHPTRPNQPTLDPQISVSEILRTVRASGLTWGASETPFSLFLTVRKRFLQSAKISSSARLSPTTALGVEDERLQKNIQIEVKKLQKLQTEYDRLKLDYEKEVNNNEVLNRGIAEVKAESSNYQAKLEEARKQLDLKTAIIKSQGKTADDLAKSKAEAKRLKDKLDDSLKTIAELKVKVDRSIPLDRLYAVQAASSCIEEKLLEAKDEIQITGEELAYSRSEISTLKVKLENSKSRNKVLEVQLSELITVSNMVEDPSNNNLPVEKLNDKSDTKLPESDETTHEVGKSNLQGVYKSATTFVSASDVPKLSRKVLKKEKQRMKKAMTNTQNCAQDDTAVVVNNNDTAMVTAPILNGSPVREVLRTPLPLSDANLIKLPSPKPKISLSASQKDKISERLGRLIQSEMSSALFNYEDKDTDLVACFCEKFTAEAKECFSTDLAKTFTDWLRSKKLTWRRCEFQMPGLGCDNCTRGYRYNCTKPHDISDSRYSYLDVMEEEHFQDVYRVIQQNLSTLVSAPINCEQWEGNLTPRLSLPSEWSFLALFPDARKFSYTKYFDYNSYALGCLIVWEVLGKDAEDKEPMKEMVADQVSPAMGQEAQLE